MNEIDEKEYLQAIQKESAFWDHFNEDAVAHGIPHWLDLRKATPLNREIWSPFDDPKYEEILRGDIKQTYLKLAMEKKGKALDVGCGLGWLALELARNGIDVLALDISQKSLQIAREYYQKEKPPGKIDYQWADLNHLSLPTNEFDLIVVWDVLHHIANLKGLFSEIRSALKPDGRFLIFDHKGMEEKNLRFYRIFHYFVPAAPSMYFNKIRFWLENFGLLRRRRKEEATPTKPVIADAPFEHHSEKDILPLLQHYFPGIHLQTHLCFSMHLAHFHRLPKFGEYFFLRLLKRLDDWLIRRGYLTGEYFLALYPPPHKFGVRS